MRSLQLTPVLLGSLLSLSAPTAAHSEHAEVVDGATYAEIHMAQEHHMDNFDIQSFFHLHDLNRDKVLDVNELESIYGVHHEKLKKQTGSVEVHTETAKEIVRVVLAKLDTNGDGVLTMREFVAGGVGGLPNFKGVEHLGHHYDAEGEYFLHHEEKYHNTPETQNEEDYIHPEDIEHFMAHEAIEAQEEERTAEYTGQPVEITEDTPIMPEGGVPEQQILFDSVDHTPGAVDAQSPEMQTGERKKGSEKVAEAQAARKVVQVAQKEDNRTEVHDKGSEDKKDAFKVVPPPQPKQVERVKTAAELKRDEEVKKREERQKFAREQAEKFGKAGKEARSRGEWGGDSFARPRDQADKLRKNLPYKYKLKKSWFGEF